MRRIDYLIFLVSQGAYDTSSIVNVLFPIKIIVTTISYDFCRDAYKIITLTKARLDIFNQGSDNTYHACENSNTTCCACGSFNINTLMEKHKIKSYTHKDTQGFNMVRLTIPTFIYKK